MMKLFQDIPITTTIQISDFKNHALERVSVMLLENKNLYPQFNNFLE